MHRDRMKTLKRKNLTKKITFHIFVRIFHFRHNEFDMQKINVLRSQSHQYYQKNVVNRFRVFQFDEFHLLFFV